MAGVPPDTPATNPPCEDPRSLSEISRLARLASTGVVPDAIRRLKRLAPSIGADGFVLFFAGRGTAAARLMPCFDESFPARSGDVAKLVGPDAEALHNHTTVSTLPAAWGLAKPPPQIALLPPILPDRMGLALPVTAEPAHAGIFVFTGSELCTAMAAIEDLHLACFEIFASVAQMKSNSIASSISRRELECLMLTAAGRTSEDMARILGLSIHTTNQYLTSAAAKLDAVNRTQAVAKAIRLGLIE